MSRRACDATPNVSWIKKLGERVDVVKEEICVERRYEGPLLDHYEEATVMRPKSGFLRVCPVLWLAADVMVCSLLGLLLTASATAHMYNPYSFLGSILAYDIIEPGVAKHAAVVIPFLQLTLAVCLIMRLYHHAAYCGAMIMFTCFAAAQTVVWIRGMEISCGCFGSRFDTKVGATSLATVYGLLTLCIVRVAFITRRRCSNCSFRAAASADENAR